MMGPIVLRGLPYCALGVLLGIAYFAALGWNVRLYVGAGSGWSALLVHLLRLLVAGAAFTLCARQGAFPLLSSMAGFQMMRTAAVNQQSRALERNP
ncbi:MAG: ATP synthase subunit I [Candidatus Binataceae bacterium]